jgi:hypothetical protein
MQRTTLLAAIALSGAAHADVYSWAWTPGDGGATSNSAGTFDSVTGRFDTIARQLTWEMSFTDRITDGFTLALNNGPSPEGRAGELALVYFDATDVSNIRVSAYAYNGLNTQTSYRDGSPLSGTQSPDLIFGAAPLGSVPASVLEASIADSPAGRTLRLVLDTTAINTHTPRDPGDGGPDAWYGIGFDTALAVRLRPVTGLVTEYNGDGSLSFWSGRQGWLDGAEFVADVPAPGAAMAGLALVGLSGRRRTTPR